MRRQAVVLPYTSGRPHARMLADRVTRADIIPHIELTDDLANELATSPDENVRAALAARPDLPATVVDLLAADPGTVRPADLSGLALSVLPQGPCELHEPAGMGGPPPNIRTCRRRHWTHCWPTTTPTCSKRHTPRRICHWRPCTRP